MKKGGMSEAGGPSKTVEPLNFAPSTDNENSTRVETPDLSSEKSIVASVERHHGAGVWAWATVASSFCIQFSSVGSATAFGVFQDFYVREFLTTSTSSQISWIGSTQSFLLLTMGLFTGHLFDKGYCYHLVIAGSVLQVLSLFMLSLAEPEQYYQVFLAQALGFGIGGGLSFAPSLAILAQHFPNLDDRAKVMGIAVAGTPIGGLVLPILLNQLFHEKDAAGIEGTRKAFARGARANATLITVLLLAAVLLMRTSYPRTDDGSFSEEDREKEGHGRKSIELIPLVKRFASDWPYIYFVIGMTLYEMVFLFPSFYLQLDAIKHGLDPTFAFYSLCILNGVAFFGRTVPGFFVRSLGIANMFLFSTAAATVLIFCMLAVRTVAGVTAFAIFYGFFSGALMTLMNPMLALLSESQAEIGARMGMCFAFSGLGSLTGTPIAGALLTSEFIWWRPIVFSGICCVVGFVLFTACRVMLGKRDGMFWVV